MEKKEISESIRDKALELGFDLIGFASARKLEINGNVLREWCNAGMNADMTFITRNIEKRTDPSLLFPGTRSVIVTGMNYYTVRKQGFGDVPVLSRYAYGENYHDVILPRLKKVIQHIKSLVPEAESKGFVDSAPVFEKGWAMESGLGWQGKHSILINRKTGSYFFLGIILTSVELEYDAAEKDHCGSCRLCIDSCPTKAINDNRTIDANKCISFITIERKTPVDEQTAAKLERRIFGCDICQEVCPWNNHAVQHHHPEFDLPDSVRNMTASDWINLSEEKFRRLFRKSAIGRTKYRVFMQNVTNVTKSL